MGTKKREENRLLSFERKIFRPIFGAVKEHNAWKSLYNREVCIINRQPDILNDINSRIRCLGHVFCREVLDSAKKLTLSKIVGTRRKLTPATSTLNFLEKDSVA